MGRPKQYDRDEVLKRAMTLFWKKGYEGTHLAELVDATGLNRFSLYQEFGGKEGLFSEAIDRYMLEIQPLAALLAAEPHGLANIRRYFDAMVDARFLHGCFLINTLPERNVVSRGAFGKVRRFVERAEGLFRANLEAGLAAGELPQDTDVEALAKALFTFDIGYLTYCILPVSKQDKQRILAYVEKLLR